MFIDSSALVSIITIEDDRSTLREKLNAAGTLHTSAIVVYETVLAIARKQNGGLTKARQDVDDFMLTAKVRVEDITTQIGEEALTAFERFGKGRHKAALSMGDCFSYACAKALKLPLLCKGDNFIHTDIRIA